MSKNLDVLTPAEYHAAVLKTESKPEVLNFGPMTIVIALNLAMAVGDVLDQIKRGIYYGKDIDQKFMLERLQAISKFASDMAFPIQTGRYRDPADADFFQGVPVETRQNLSPANVDLRLLHAGIGKFTESAEFIKGLMPMFFGGAADRVNLLEEIGDGGWYDEVALDVFGVTKADVDTANIKKLNDKKLGRYKKGTFLATDAVDNRDVDAERVILGAELEQKTAENVAAA